MSAALAGQRALIVGGSSGIGLASAEALLADGARVWITGRDADKLSSARAGLEAAAQAGGGEISSIACDAMEAAALRDAVREASGSEGLDIALAVPGGGGYSQVLAYGDDEFGQQIDMNLRPTYLVLKYAGLDMVRSGGGSIVAVSSTAAIMVSPFLAAYCAAKAAIDQLVRVAAEELGAQKVRVNAVRPGLTRTDATGGMFDSPLLDRFLAEQPVARPGEAEDIGRAVRFLAGPESSWVTGQCLTVDGGHTLRKFPDMEDVARGLVGDAHFDGVRRGQLPED